MIGCTLARDNHHLFRMRRFKQCNKFAKKLCKVKCTLTFKDSHIFNTNINTHIILLKRSLRVEGWPYKGCRLNSWVLQRTIRNRPHSHSSEIRFFWVRKILGFGTIICKKQFRNMVWQLSTSSSSPSSSLSPLTVRGQNILHHFRNRIFENFIALLKNFFRRITDLKFPSR